MYLTNKQIKDFQAYGVIIIKDIFTDWIEPLRLGFQNSGRWSKPAGTFVANIIASFLLGVLLGGSPSAESVTVIGTGFLGSFSTFSTVMMEVSDEVEGNRKLIATSYLCLSIIAGVAAAFLGLEVGAQ